MLDRKEALERLQQIVTIDAVYMNAPGWKLRLLDNVFTAPYCQIFEGIHSTAFGGIQHDFGLHEHVDSKEIFYQVRGECTFMDGVTLHTGEMRMIEAGTKHSCSLSDDGVCLIIVHPPESVYQKVGK